MTSNNQPLQPQDDQGEAAAQPTPQRWIHPDTLKFMGMAKELLESPAIQQAIDSDQDHSSPNP
jgi:hypothetical protein